MLDDLIELLEEYWYVAVGAVAVVGIICASSFGLIDLGFGDSDSITVEIISDEGITDPSGDGKYSPGDNVELSIKVYIGWFFEGWYDSQGNLLSNSGDYSFRPTESCKIYAKTERGYGVNLYRTVGIEEMTGRATYELDEDAVVSAKAGAGYVFDGWYDLDGNKISSSGTLTLSEHQDCVLIAKTTVDNPYLGEKAFHIKDRAQFTDDGTFMVIVNERTRDFVASSSGNLGWYVDLAPGQYELIVKGVKTDGIYGSERKSFLVDGISSNLYQWAFKGKEYSLTWDVDVSTYESYTQSDVNRSPQTTNSRLSFINYNSASVQTVAGKLTDLSAGMTDQARADFVLKFVQLCTEYELDSVYSGKTEYWKYPIETLFEGKGDCEDTSILYCALMKAMGYDVALLVYEGKEYSKGHAAASIALDSCPGGTYYEKNGLHYYYCETTSDTKNVGDIWTDYNRGQVLVVP